MEERTKAAIGARIADLYHRKGGLRRIVEGEALDAGERGRAAERAVQLLLNGGLHGWDRLGIADHLHPAYGLGFEIVDRQHREDGPRRPLHRQPG